MTTEERVAAWEKAGAKLVVKTHPKGTAEATFLPGLKKPTQNPQDASPRQATTRGACAH